VSRSVSPVLPAWDASPRLTGKRMIPLLFRSFFLQASWSFERMQSVGWTAVLSGEGRKVAPGGKAKDFLTRHLGYFNTNPVMASYLIGGVVRLEEEVAAGRASVEDVAKLKRGLTSPLASWGDTFFWATLRPAATAIGALVGLIAGVWGVLAYLVTYNVFHLFYRVRGIEEGYRYGPQVTARLSTSFVKMKVGWVRGAGLLAAGALAGLSLVRTDSLGSPVRLVIALMVIPAFLILRKRAGLGAWLGLLAIAVGLVYARLQAGR
jgi:PTS system mannose-specific IID component